MGAYAPEYSYFLPIPNTLGAYAPEKVPQAHFSAIFALLLTETENAVISVN
jgi:hypothetical protein